GTSSAYRATGRQLLLGVSRLASDGNHTERYYRAPSHLSHPLSAPIQILSARPAMILPPFFVTAGRHADRFQPTIRQVPRAAQIGCGKRLAGRRELSAAPSKPPIRPRRPHSPKRASDEGFPGRPPRC